PQLGVAGAGHTQWRDGRGACRLDILVEDGTALSLETRRLIQELNNLGEAAKVVQTYDVISYEDPRIRTMVQSHSLAPSPADAGWGAFLAILAFKAESARKRVQAVNPAFTSQACSGRGVLVQKGWSVRWHACQDCGTSLPRRHNATLTLL